MKPQASASQLRPLTILTYGVLVALMTCSPESSIMEPGNSPAKVPTASEEVVGNAVGRPNIVVIMSDDQTVDEMRVMPQTRSLIGDAGRTFKYSADTYTLCC